MFFSILPLVGSTWATAIRITSYNVCYTKLLRINVNEIDSAQIKVAKELANKFNSTLLLLGVLPSDAQKSSISSIISNYVQIV